ncbi:MAG: lysostaphin resistance A-like protein [Planctomycetota bacterium]|jgi:membrane protease YdiL (CAAX protease family)
MTAPDMLGQLGSLITVDCVIVTVGVAIFAVWLLRTSLGRRALAEARPRRNSMAPYTPLIPFAVWFLGFALVRSIIDFFIAPVHGVGGVLLDNVVFGILAMLTVVGLILPLASYHFAGGLKGFGLRLKTIPRDLGAAFVHLLAIWPLMAAAFFVTTEVGQLLQGPGFDLPKHDTLKAMEEHPHVFFQALLVFLAVVVAPLIEETVFRGMFQTMIRSYLGRPWIAIVVTSVLFVIVHKNLSHWPALFALALGLGYAYEKSGSLFRPIFMHVFFNGMTMAFQLAA